MEAGEPAQIVAGELVPETLTAEGLDSGNWEQSGNSEGLAAAETRVSPGEAEEGAEESVVTEEAIVQLDPSKVEGVVAVVSRSVTMVTADALASGPLEAGMFASFIQVRVRVFNLLDPGWATARRMSAREARSSREMPDELRRSSHGTSRDQSHTNDDHEDRRRHHHHNRSPSETRRSESNDLERHTRSRQDSPLKSRTVSPVKVSGASPADAQKVSESPAATLAGPVPPSSPSQPTTASATLDSKHLVPLTEEEEERLIEERRRRRAAILATSVTGTRAALPAASPPSPPPANRAPVVAAIIGGAVVSGAVCSVSQPSWVGVPAMLPVPAPAPAAIPPAPGGSISAPLPTAPIPQVGVRLPAAGAPATAVRKKDEEFDMFSLTPKDSKVVPLIGVLTTYPTPLPQADAPAAQSVPRPPPTTQPAVGGHTVDNVDDAEGYYRPRVTL